MHDPEQTARLADYRAGRMPEAERAAFEAEMASDAELGAWNRLAGDISKGFDVPEAMPGEIGWARLKRSIQAERAPAPGRRFTAWQLLGSVAAALLLWQVGVAPLIQGDLEEPGFVTASDPSEALRVAFVPSAAEADIRAALAEIGGQIVDGPSALGLYSVALPEGADIAAAAEVLRASAGVVETVTEP